MIRISVPFTSLWQRTARCLPQARCLCSENVAIGFKTSIEAYSVEKKTAGAAPDAATKLNRVSAFSTIANDINGEPDFGRKK